ncbi:alpha/beta hydrolase family protein [Bradyrhizobium sp. 2TAF24]|uniref:alpha/beta hydrolase family protein n=1 Tax=Bradyrhizobium sp. 2TAF24 TaxID=3233011 RepID=UPI003F90275B
MAEAVLDDVFIDDIALPTGDGLSLAATLHMPRAPRHHAVLINSAAAVPRRFYRNLACYIAARGCVVMTYDYRGIGGSRPKSLAGFKATMADWAEKDAACAVAWMRERYPSLPLSYIGHSFGGQALGLLPNNDQIARALLVSAQAPFWKQLPTPENYRVFALLNFAGRPIARLMGYVPGRIGLGEDMPRDVFLQWTKWLMSERYYFDDPSLSALANYANYRHPLMALCISDDAWAPRAAVDRLCAGFTATTPQVVAITPAQADAKAIGHFGFFRAQHRERLWRPAVDWLLTA